MADEHVELEVEEELEEVPPLDPEAAARRSAAMSFIRKWGDPVLKSRATPVDRFDDTLRQQVQRMAGIMRDATGVGLAAPQLGISQRLLVYRIGSDAPLITLVNPELEWRSEDLETFEEGCLSIPSVAVDVERPVHVRVRAHDEHGDERLVEASGLEARVIQHEMDHLDGVLMLDRASREDRKEALRALREQEQADRAA
ncbi:MAG TPA: peptide deformylase [Myxococcota bacterium]|nr:peptide deformylase [Myxococcota bacterium]